MIRIQRIETCDTKKRTSKQEQTCKIEQDQPMIEEASKVKDKVPPTIELKEMQKVESDFRPKTHCPTMPSLLSSWTPLHWPVHGDTH